MYNHNIICQTRINGVYITIESRSMQLRCCQAWPTCPFQSGPFLAVHNAIQRPRFPPRRTESSSASSYQPFWPQGQQACTCGSRLRYDQGSQCWWRTLVLMLGVGILEGWPKCDVLHPWCPSWWYCVGDQRTPLLGQRVGWSKQPLQVRAVWVSQCTPIPLGNSSIDLCLGDLVELLPWWPSSPQSPQAPAFHQLSGPYLWTCDVQRFAPGPKLDRGWCRCCPCHHDTKRHAASFGSWPCHLSGKGLPRCH